MEKTIKKEKDPESVAATVIEGAMKIPGVKVNRTAFLMEAFQEKEKEVRDAILEQGPVEAGISVKELRKKAAKLVSNRTLMSSGASFLSGLPGGFGMAVAIPADVAQFYGVCLRLAQEIAYLYGEPDIWNNSGLDDESANNQLILYCGVMLGATGAAQSVRLMASSVAKQIVKQLPRKALMKTAYYPVIKQVAKALGVRMTKEIFAKGVSKAVPVVGGLVSGGITFATMRPMGMRLVEALEQAHFGYSEQAYQKDLDFVTSVETEPAQEKQNRLEEIRQAKELLDSGVITEEEFAAIKAKVISNL